MAVFHACRDCTLISWLVFLTLKVLPLSAVVVDLVPDFGTGTLSCPLRGEASKACPRGTITYTCTTTTTGALVWDTSLTVNSVFFISSSPLLSTLPLVDSSMPAQQLFQAIIVENGTTLVSNLTVQEEFRDRAEMGAVSTVTITCQDNITPGATERTETLQIADVPSPPINVMRSPLDLCSGPLDSITVEWECPTSTGGTDITRYTVVVVDLRNYTVEDGRSVDIAGLTQNINYTVFVVAENCAGESVFSNATYIFNSTVPDPPTNFAIIQDCPDILSNTTPIPVVISWMDQSLLCPAIQVCVNCSNDTCLPLCRNSSMNEFRIDNTVSGVNYTARFELVNGIGRSGLSGLFPFDIDPEECVPDTMATTEDSANTTNGASTTGTSAPEPDDTVTIIVAVFGSCGVVLLVSSDVILFVIWWKRRPIITKKSEIAVIVILCLTVFGIIFVIAILSILCCFKKAKKVSFNFSSSGQKDENLELKEPSPGSSPAPNSGAPTAVYADPNAIQREEFPGTQDVYTVVDKKAKTHKPEDHLPMYQDPNTISHEVAPTGELYAQPDKPKKGRGSKKNQPPPPPHTEQELADMYSQPDKSKKQQSQGLTYTEIGFQASGKTPDSQPGVFYSDVKPH